MYNNKVKSLLKQILPADTDIFTDQIRYKVEDGFSCLEFYISKENISFKVFGDPYLLAMSKWLQLSLKDKRDFSNIDLVYLVKEFAIPDNRVRSAIQVLELIEKLYER